MSDYLGNAYPKLKRRLRKKSFAALPTPISHRDFEYLGEKRSLAIKHDDQSNPLYGGNKVRKLEYLIARASERGAERIATFGAAGSNHALATAIFAREFGFGCTCFLAHQKRSPQVAQALGMHLRLGTELVRYGGKVPRLALFRRYLQNRRTWVIPLGGSCWLGALGFVNAGLELAMQIETGELEKPARIYIANGTMGSVAGLALGIALAGLDIDIHAVRVADNRFAKPDVLYRLIRKTATLLNRFDPAIPAGLADAVRILWRDEFFAGGYAIADAATEDAIAFARDDLGLSLDTTYTGKAMAALLHDLRTQAAGPNTLFWNTYNSRPLPAITSGTEPAAELPEDFRRYFD